MSDLLSGLVVAVSSTPVGTQTAAEALAGATELLLDDTIDMASTGAQVTIGGTVTDYESSNDDESTITLTVPLAATLAEGAEVLVYPPRVEKTALVLVDGASDPIPATVPSNMQDMLRDGVREEEDREQVRLTRDGEWSWSVFDLDGQPLARDAVFSYYPSIMASKGTDQTVAHNAWTVLNGWFVFDSDRIALDPTTNRFIIQADGVYDIRVGATFTAGGSGNRAVRMGFWSVFGTAGEASRMVKYPSDGQTAVETAQYRRMLAGEAIQFEAWQNSGADLEIRGGNVLTDPIFTDCAIRWVGPL